MFSVPEFGHLHFKHGKEITESEYNHYLDASKQVFGYEFFSLNSVDYHHLKDVLDKHVNANANR